MLTIIEARTGLGSLLSLPLADFSEGFSIEGIDGLDPVKATIVSSAYATQDGEQYHSSRREKRNIVLSLGLNPDYSTGSARTLRNRLYDFFMPKSEVSLRFVSDDSASVDITGRIESLDSPLFTEKPKATISILCFNPDFVDLTPIRVSGATVSDLTEKLVSYSGTVETGFVFKLLVNRTLTEFSLKNRPGDNLVRSMDFAGSFLAGDIVEVSTVPGSKGVYLNRGTTRTSLLYALSSSSPWLALMQGPNYLRAYAAGAAIPYTIDYTNKYGGL